MHHMRIKTGEHEGVPQYSTVPILHYMSVRTEQELERSIRDGYVVVEFEHPIDQVQRMSASKFPVHVARLK